MIIEFEVMVYNRMVDMIQFEKVLQGSRWFFMLCLDVMYVDGVDINS